MRQKRAINRVKKGRQNRGEEKHFREFKVFCENCENKKNFLKKKLDKKIFLIKKNKFLKKWKQHFRPRKKLIKI